MTQRDQAAIDLLVIAKEPVPGRVKTRLCPPCTPNEAATVAQGALTDTLTAVAAAAARRRVLVLDGSPGDWVPDGFEIVPQTAGGLDRRLAHAFSLVVGPAFLVGMDTPQIDAAVIDRSTERLLSGDAEAVLGLAPDGGYWSIGFTSPTSGAFEGVPMSCDDTGSLQLERLRDLGLRTTLIQEMRDVDHWSDAVQVATEAPHTAFAAAVSTVEERIEVSA